MKISINFSLVVLLAHLVLVVAPSHTAELASIPPQSQNSPGIDVSWRKKSGDFPQDKPGYLILTTEDALTYSKILPEFVKQKESMGFYVYVATEKDYGSDKTGNAQAAQVRTWMREFHKRARLKYALLIGNRGPRSADLPSPTIPDGEHNGMDSAYSDLDGKWVDIYLNTTEKDTRPGNEKIQGSIFHLRALKQGGKREDELIMSRINYVGNEIGNGAYDLDRILEKTIRYERDTVAGKNLDWRATGLSITTNYGAGGWDAPWLKAMENEGGTFELRSSRGWIGELPPENVVDGRPTNNELLAQTHRRGLLATCSHGWNRGCEEIVGQENLLRDIDPRYPSAVSVAACTGFSLGDGCHLGQAWLRGGAIFAIGTSWSGNNNTRVPFHTFSAPGIGSGVHTRYTWQGMEWDIVVGAFLTDTRYLDPRLSAFFQQDFIGFGGGQANLVILTGNDSVNYVDRSGKRDPRIGNGTGTLPADFGQRSGGRSGISPVP